MGRGEVRAHGPLLVLLSDAQQLVDDEVSDDLGSVEQSSPEVGFGVVAECQRVEATRREQCVNLHHGVADHLRYVCVQDLVARVVDALRSLVAPSRYPNRPGVWTALVRANHGIPAARRARIGSRAERHRLDSQLHCTERVVGADEVREELLFVVVKDEQRSLVLWLFDHELEVAGNSRGRELALDDIDHGVSQSRWRPIVNARNSSRNSM